MPYTFEPISTVARITHADDETVRRWCRRQLVVAKQLAGGEWRIRVDDDGFPVRTSSKSPRGPRRAA